MVKGHGQERKKLSRIHKHETRNGLRQMLLGKKMFYEEKKKLLYSLMLSDIFKI